MENDPRDFHATADEDEDEMENEFGGAGTYNQEIQTVFQDMLAHILGRPLTATNSLQGEADDDESGDQRRTDASDGEQRLSGMRTWTSNLGSGGSVSVSFGDYTAPGDQSGGSGDHPRRPMFIDPEENAPISLGNFMSSLLGALGGNLRAEGGPMMGMPVGNLGDYVWGQNSLDDIITQIMEQNQGAHAPPPASQESILKLPKRLITPEELQRNLDCGICMEEYKPEEYAVELPCKHVYHKDCIDHWLGMNGTCPICRAAIETRSDGAPHPPQPHSDLPGSFPSSPAVTTARQEEDAEQQNSAAHLSVPEPEPMD
ncbi:hypothetical protein IWW57_001227 [Coemansia sp. S610]|nr:hypothetical protein IWW57_001227 [Coemansia sp. S610]KAJ2417540.1 hypothetical protein GGI10_000125 [Coemansia sp. RSA 2530]KAJ2696200.1 hypothetical protein H4218_004749 [Coemansia sp. IMI 209128]